MSTVHVLRTKRLKDDKLIWIAFDTVSTVRGLPRQTKRSVLEEWKRQKVKDGDSDYKITDIIRYEGICRPSEAVATIVSIQNPTGGR